jgi:hypothetical protein
MMKLGTPRWIRLHSKARSEILENGVMTFLLVLNAKGQLNVQTGGMALDSRLLAERCETREFDDGRAHVAESNGKFIGLDLMGRHGQEVLPEFFRYAATKRARASGVQSVYSAIFMTWRDVEAARDHVLAHLDSDLAEEWTADLRDELADRLVRTLRQLGQQRKAKVEASSRWRPTPAERWNATG